jgi:DNA-binding transcriptional regulator YiaG
MPNIASVLKTEVSRIARKELKGETQALKAAVAQQRSQITELKRRLQSLELQLKRVGKVAAKSNPKAAAAEQDHGPNLRFSAKGFGAQRQRLGLTAAELAKILGVSQLSVYKWEGGKARPRAKQLPGIAALRTMGKREAAKLLEADAPAAPPAA